MALAWHRAPSLTQLLTEVNNQWPNRSKASDGTIGDAAHSSRLSDHNPNGRRSVNAVDVTNKGIDRLYLIAKANQDRRTNYVISQRVIYSRSRGFRPRTYLGPNPHTFHVHISIMQSASAEQDRSSWGITKGSASGGAGTTARPGLPGTGDGPSSPTDPPKGQLTVSEAAAINKNIDALRTEFNARFSALGEIAGGRASIDRQAQTTARLMQVTGFDRPVLEEMGRTNARHVSNVLAGQLDGLLVVYNDLKANGITEETLTKAIAVSGESAAKGAEKGARDGVNAVTALWDAKLRALLEAFLFDNGLEHNPEVVDLAVTALAESVNEAKGELATKNPKLPKVGN